MRELWIFAYEDGRRSRQHEIDNLNARADNLYLAAYSPKVRAEMIAARLDTHFEREAARLYEEWSR